MRSALKLSKSVRLTGPVPTEALRDFESRSGLRLPLSLRNFYLEVANAAQLGPLLMFSLVPNLMSRKELKWAWDSLERNNSKSAIWSQYEHALCFAARFPTAYYLRLNSDVVFFDNGNNELESTELKFADWIELVVTESEADDIGPGFGR